MRSVLIAIIAALVAVPLYAEPHKQFAELIDLPTAGTLNRGEYAINLRMQPEGNLLVGASVALLDRLNFGFTYGGNNIIGYGNPEWNPHYPAFQAKYRLWDESYWGPAVALGFDSQGFGKYFEAPDRYTIKSRGFYAAASKSYKFLGRLGLHAAGNYSLEQRRGPDNPVDLTVGLEKSLNNELTAVGEYDFAFNDDIKDQAFGEGCGYLNAGVRWVFNEKLLLEFDLKNILKNGYGDQPEATLSRTIKLAYFDAF